MQSIVYESSNQYCILSMTKKEAQKRGLDNPDNVEIKTTNNSILIKRKSVASGEDTSDNRDTQSRSDSEDEYHE